MNCEHVSKVCITSVITSLERGERITSVTGPFRERSGATKTLTKHHKIVQRRGSYGNFRVLAPARVWSTFSSPGTEFSKCGAPGLSGASFGTLLAPLESLLSRSWPLLGRSWDPPTGPTAPTGSTEILWTASTDRRRTDPYRWIAAPPNSPTATTERTDRATQQTAPTNIRERTDRSKAPQRATPLTNHTVRPQQLSAPTSRTKHKSASPASKVQYWTVRPRSPVQKWLSNHCIPKTLPPDQDAPPQTPPNPLTVCTDHRPPCTPPCSL